MRNILFFFFLAVLPLFADPKDPYSLAVTEGEPSSLAEGCVSVITGDLYLNEVDAMVQAYVPLRLPRQYLSGDGKGTLANWSFINHLSAIYKGKEKEHKITLQEPNGSTFVFKCPEDEVYDHFRKKKHPPKFRPPSAGETPGLTNTSQGDIGGHSNLQNACVRLEEKGKYFTVYCPDQTKRRYKVHHRHKHFKDVFKGEESKKIKYLLESETFPIGHKVIYDYDSEDRLKSIRTANPANNKTYASATFNYHHKHADKIPNVDISLSDGRTLRYQYEQKGDDVFLLRSVTSPDSPVENIFYHGRDHSGNLVSRISLPDLRYYDIDYYREDHNDVGGTDVKVKNRDDPRFLRVKVLKAPVGSDANPHVTHRFFYFPDQRYTDVREIDNTLTRYHYSPSMRLETMLRFDNRDVLNNRETFDWSEGGDLRSRSFYDAKGTLLFSRRFQYDGRGNVTKEEFCGNLSGQNQSESYLIKRDYSNDERDLLLKEEESNNKITYYIYHPNSALLYAKFVYEGNQIKIRNFYDYNGDYVLVRETQDDGATQYKENMAGVKTRTIKLITPVPAGPFADMPQIIEEKYWDGAQEVLLRKTVLTYTTGGRIEKRQVYDASDTLQYTLHYTYDHLGRLSTETNALGQIATYTYDEAGNKKTVSEASGRRSAVMNYDYCNRLTQTHEVGFDGITHITQYRYDGKHNKTAVIDSFGNTTGYVYDAFGHVIQTNLPKILDEKGNVISPVIYSSYDSAGREVSRTDAKGYTTTTQYNARSQVTSIQHPDGTQERFIYNLDGTLKTHIDAEGFATTHTYDAFGRRTSTKDPRGNTTIFTYDSFHLIATQDAEGNLTSYTYDGAGRKIAEEKNSERIEYAYDSLNRLHCVKTGDLFTLTEYDLLDRVIEERQEDAQGNLLSKVTYEYDDAGNKKSVTRSIMGQDRQEHFEYDSFDRLISHTDELGYETQISYDEHYQNDLGQRVLQKTTTDALGQKTLETYDSLGRNVRIEVQNSQGTTCSLEEKNYDGNNNLSRQTSTLFPQRTIIITNWEYDNRNRLIALIEPLDKITTYNYTPRGLLKETTKPDQVVLKRSYDANGNLANLSSSDRSIMYAFGYNTLNQLTSSTDLLTQSTTSRTLDPQGRVLTERLAHNLTLSNSYDLQGRRTKLTLPNQSFINYTHDALHLREISRCDSSGNPLYTHTFGEYDLSHHLLSQQLIGSLGEVDFAISPHGKRSAIASSYFSQNVINYDPVGNITAIETQSQRTSYSYDDLYQLIEEAGHTYAYDSHFNRLQKDDEAYTLNDLNQLSTTQYDPNGNPRLFGDTTYTYDALDRLISVENPSQRLTFTYDSFNRRLSKTIYEQIEGSWQCISQHLYFYDGQNEIGAADTTGKIIQLRVLGSTSYAEIGAAIAIELEGRVFAPLHDLFGNVTTLVSLDGTVSESYSYDSFGNHTATTNLSNPWRFASKRLDETGLIYYGRRYFDPVSGRWTTPDPIGFEGGINLYAFIQNNPLTHLDLYGLSILSVSPPMVTVPMVTVPMVTTPMVAPKQVSTKQIASNPLPVAHHVDTSSRSFGSKAKSMAINALRNPRLHGSLQAFGGVIEAGIGGGMTFGSAGLGASLGWPVMMHGLDQFITGMGTAFSGNVQNSTTVQLLQKVGISHNTAALTNDYLSLLGSIGGIAAIRASQLAAFSTYSLPAASEVRTIDPHSIRFSQSSISNYFRDGSCIDDLAFALRKGTINANEVPQIRLVNRDNLQFTLDNRRLEAFRRADVQVPYRMATHEEMTSEAWKFTTTNEGTSIRIRGK